jgi:hypothetical protein
LAPKKYRNIYQQTEKFNYFFSLFTDRIFICRINRRYILITVVTNNVYQFSAKSESPKIKSFSILTAKKCINKKGRFLKKLLHYTEC